MLPTLLITLAFIGIGWYVIIRPQQVRIREQQAVVASLEPGDHVITAGGIHGTLVEVGDDAVVVEVAPDVRITLARPAISRRIDPTSTAAQDLGPAPAEEAGPVTETHDEGPTALGGAA